MSWLMSIRDGLDIAWAFLLMGVLHGTVLAALTALLAVTILKHARPALMTALWSVVLIKFAVPLGPAIPLSLSGLLNRLMTSDDAAAVPAAGVGPGDVGTAAALSTGELALLMAELAAFLLYIVLVARILVRSAKAQRAHRTWSETLPRAPEDVALVAQDAARIVGLRSLPTMRMGDTLAAPHIVGLFRPVLIIPTHVHATRDRDVLHAALVHEMAHLRRGDTWLRALQLFISALFFFWPVVAWVNRRIDAYREMACDQWAITWSTLTAEQYARSLVELARRGLRQPVEATLVTITLGALLSTRGNQLHERVQVLLRGGAKPRLGWSSGLGLVAWALISLGGADSARADLSAIRAECEIEPGLVEYILTAFPEADADGNGELSRDEVCAYQKRIKEEMSSLDESASASLQSLQDREHRLASLESEWLECAACSCSVEEADKAFERRICTAESP